MIGLILFTVGVFFGFVLSAILGAGKRADEIFEDRMMEGEDDSIL